MALQATMHDDVTAPAIAGEGPSRAPSSRRCIATQREAPPEEMVRFAVAADGTVVPDIGRKLPGRGLWVTADGDALALACRKNLFARAARRATVVPDDLESRTCAILARRCLDLLGIARRAGQCVAGAEKVREARAKWTDAVVLVASDSAAGTVRTAQPGGQRSEIGLFSSDELGRVFGRDRVVNVALRRGRLADQLVTEARRLAGLRNPQFLGIRERT